jgi:hypothetical protein
MSGTGKKEARIILSARSDFSFIFHGTPENHQSGWCGPAERPKLIIVDVRSTDPMCASLCSQRLQFRYNLGEYRP